MKEFEQQNIEPSMENNCEDQKNIKGFELKADTVLRLFEEVAQNAYIDSEQHKALADIMNW